VIDDVDLCTERLCGTEIYVIDHVIFHLFRQYKLTCATLAYFWSGWDITTGISIILYLEVPDSVSGIVAMQRRKN